MTNVDSAKIFFGVVLKQLQTSFPAAFHLTHRDIWPEFERLAIDGEIALKNRRSYKLLSISEACENENIQQLYTKQMLEWMKVEGYIRSNPTSGFHLDYVLSSKSLALLNLEIQKDEATLGSKLTSIVTKVGDKAAGEIISNLIGRAFSMAQGI